MNTFDWILKLHEKYDVKAYFFFMGGATNAEYDWGYDLRNPFISRLLSTVSQFGHYIGLHPSFETRHNRAAIAKEYSNLQAVLEELKIEQPLNSSRQHFLRLSIPETFKILNSLNIKFDNSLGFADQIGFRAGCSFPYNSFDPVANDVLDLKIQPLCLMDVSLFSEAYMNLTNELDIKANINELFENVRRVNGTFSFLWHNNQLDTNLKKICYEHILRFNLPGNRQFNS